MNILPKKSWHVFKPENVEKVLKDEAAAKQREAQRFEAELEAQKDLRKARMRNGGTIPTHDVDSDNTSDQIPTATHNLRDSGQASKSINLFEDIDFDYGAKSRE